MELNMDIVKNIMKVLNSEGTIMELNPVISRGLATVFMAAALFTSPCFAQERLEVRIAPGGKDGAPEGWKIKEWKGRAIFEVVEDKEAGPVLHLRSRASSSAAYVDLKFDIKKYPVIHWKWKAVELPRGADVRQKGLDDQAAQVYVIFPRFPAAVNSRLVGYIWDTTAPEGGTFTSTKTSNTKYVVVKSGPKDLGRWIEETRDVYADYKKLFNEEPPEAGSVSLMIDSDDTASSAESFIGGIYFTRE